MNRLGQFRHYVTGVFALPVRLRSLRDERSQPVIPTRAFSAKAFESAKLNGLLVVALDANEQFKSQHRCCPACCQRQLEIQDVAGQTQTVTEYYHRQVSAQIHGPDFSVILDVEPLRPGEDEAAAALSQACRSQRSWLASSHH